MVDLEGHVQWRGSTCMQWRHALDQPHDWSQYNGDEREDQRNLADATDQRTVGRLIQPHQIVVLSLLGGVPGIVLGLEVLDAEHIIGGRDVRKQGCNNEPDADHVKPARFWCRSAGLPQSDSDRPGKSEPAQ